jgi:hypothetical protein
MPETGTNWSRPDSAIRALAEEVRAAMDRRHARLAQQMRRGVAPDDRDLAVQFLRVVQGEDTIYENAVHDALDRYRRATHVEERA